MKLSEMFAHWKLVHADTLATIDKFRDEELFFTPFPGSWTVGQLMVHIPDTEEFWFREVIEEKYPTPFEGYRPEDYPTVEAVRTLLIQVHTRTEAWLETLDETGLERVIVRPSGHRRTVGWIIWHVVEHEIHHRGELSLILGMLGREGLDV